MKRNFSKSSNREKVDKIEKKATLANVAVKDKNAKRRLSIYDDFEDEEMDDIDPKFIKNIKSKK